MLQDNRWIILFFRDGLLGQFQRPFEEDSPDTDEAAFERKDCREDTKHIAVGQIESGSSSIQRRITEKSCNLTTMT